MGYGYGIERARDILLKLATNNEYKDKLNAAWSEIDVIQESDVSKEVFNEIEVWKRSYLKNENDGATNFEALTEQLVELCSDIIEGNSKIEE